MASRKCNYFVFISNERSNKLKIEILGTDCENQAF